MLIDHWMTRSPVVTLPDTSIMKAAKMMKENAVRRLPVVDETGLLVGVVSDRDIKEASPSKATTLDMYELYYLLSEIKVSDIMTSKVFSVRPDDTMEKAAVIMMRKKIGGMPVVDESGKVVGVVTETDVFNVLARITGVLLGGVQLAFDLADEAGTLKPVLSDLKAADARILSILTSYKPAGEGRRHVYIRIRDMEEERLSRLLKSLGDNHELLYWTRDAL